MDALFIQLVTDTMFLYQFPLRAQCTWETKRASTRPCPTLTEVVLDFVLEIARKIVLAALWQQIF